jgi:hypothetical protein
MQKSKTPQSPHALSFKVLYYIKLVHKEIVLVLCLLLPRSTQQRVAFYVY